MSVEVLQQYAIFTEIHTCDGCGKEQKTLCFEHFPRGGTDYINLCKKCLDILFAQDVIKEEEPCTPN